MQQLSLFEKCECPRGGRYPEFAVWENVPGAFSSNRGEDFRRVLEELGEAEIPTPKNGKWAAAGLVELQDRSIAWRVLDAQYWGVPQRRKRIFVVVDFTGGCASEILFKPESGNGNIEESRAQGQEAARDVGKGTREDNKPTILNDQGGSVMNVSNVVSTLRAEMHGNIPIIQYYENHPSDSRITGPHEVASTVTTAYGTGGGNTPYVLSIAGNTVGRAPQYGGNGLGICNNVSHTLNTADRHCVAYRFKANAGTTDQQTLVENGTPTLTATADIAVCGFLGYGHYHQADKSKTLLACDDVTTSDLLIIGGTQQNTYIGKDTCPTLTQAMGAGGGHIPAIANSSIVRRLTPLECERLQGFPDNWTAGHSDSARYRALGNSVAVPCVEYIMQNIADALKRS